jgi:rhamnose utilization protein RhaD (predicted bifunctional aldolase and dehydrogenase)
MPHRIMPDLLKFAHQLGDPAREFVIFGEGDCSARIDAKAFLVKAQGKHLHNVAEHDFVPMTFEPLLELVARRPNARPGEVARCLEAASGRKTLTPSKESFFHAVLLDLPNVQYIAHTHPTYVAGILASPKAEAFASMRLFPAHVMLCGPRSLFVPYMDPGLPLAVELRYRLENYINQHGDPPVTIMLANHGMIAMGPSPEVALAATEMMQKAALAYVSAQACGGAIPLPERDVQRLVEEAGGKI